MHKHLRICVNTRHSLQRTLCGELTPRALQRQWIRFASEQRALIITPRRTENILWVAQLSRTGRVSFLPSRYPYWDGNLFSAAFVQAFLDMEENKRVTPAELLAVFATLGLPDIRATAEALSHATLAVLSWVLFSCLLSSDKFHGRSKCFCRPDANI